MLADPTAPLGKCSIRVVSPGNARPTISRYRSPRQPPGRHAPSSALDLSADRQPEQQHDDWYADAVVETAFQIECFAHHRRHCRICHDRLTERRICRRQHRRQQCHFQRLERGEDDRGDRKPSTIVKGRPINSSRSGSPRFRLTTLKSALAASVKRTMASVSSARSRNPSPLCGCAARPAHPGRG